MFYKILLDLDKRYALADATIDFIEPNPRGKYKRELFVVSEEEKTNLIVQIAAMVDDLVSGALLQKTCESEDPQVRALSVLVKKRYGVTI